jgi:CRISPR/Cas system CMR subunit Cmr6 (Cas7 group RAMP superfamily)
MLSALKLAGLSLLLTLSGCALTSRAPDFSGLKDIDGSDAVHINMTKVALHFGVVVPFIGDASLKGAVRDFTEEAKKEGAERVRIVQSDETTLWWILPPVSFILTPRFTNVAGEALLAYNDTTPQRQTESKAENLKAD